MNLTIAAAVSILIVLLSGPSVWADSRQVEKQLKSEYTGKILTLRHFYHGDHLKFRSDGSLASDANEGPWTVDGRIAVEEIRLHDGLLEINGRRIYVIFDSKSRPQDTLTILGNYKGEERKEVEKLLRKGSATKIEVELLSTTPGSDEVFSALRAVFAVPANR